MGCRAAARFELIPCVAKPASRIVLAQGVLQLPDNVVFALLAVAVLEPVNSTGLRVPPDYFLSRGDRAYPIMQWWAARRTFGKRLKSILYPELP